MQEVVETYEEAVRKQVAIAKQAKLKEQATKEQESKAKSIKDKQQPQDNPNHEPMASIKVKFRLSIADFLA